MPCLLGPPSCLTSTSLTENSQQASLHACITALEADLAATKANLEAVTRDLKSPAATTVKTHISLLHEYNEIRDIGQGLLGMVADNRGVRISDVYGEFGVDVKD